MQVELLRQMIDASQLLYNMMNASGTFISEDCCKSNIRPSGECKLNVNVKGLLQVNH